MFLQVLFYVIFLVALSVVQSQSVKEGVNCSPGHNIAQWLVDFDTSGIKSLRLTCTDASTGIINNNNGLGSYCVGQVNSISYAVNPFNVLVFLSFSCNGTVTNFGLQGSNVLSNQACQPGSGFSSLFIRRNTVTQLPQYISPSTSSVLENVTCSAFRPSSLLGSISDVSMSVSSSQVVSSPPIVGSVQAIGTETATWRLINPISTDFGCLRYVNGSSKYTCLQGNVPYPSTVLAPYSLSMAINLKQLLTNPMLFNYTSASTVFLKVQGEFESIYNAFPVLTGASFGVTLNLQSIQGSYYNPVVGFLSRLNQGVVTGYCPQNYNIYRITYGVNASTGFIISLSFTCCKYFNDPYHFSVSSSVGATSRAVTSGNGITIVQSPDASPVDGISLSYSSPTDAVPSALSFSTPFRSNNVQILDNNLNSTGCIQLGAPFGYLPSRLTTVVNSEGYIEAIGLGCNQVWIQVNTQNNYTQTCDFIQSNYDFTWSVQLSLSGTNSYFWVDMGTSYDFLVNASVSIHFPIEVPLQNMDPCGSFGDIIQNSMTRSFIIPSYWNATTMPVLYGTLVLDVKSVYGWMYTFYMPVTITVGTVTYAITVPPTSNSNNPGGGTTPFTPVTNGKALLGAFSTVNLKVYANQTVSTVNPFSITYLQPVANEIPSWRLIQPVDISIGCLRYKVNNRAFCLQNGTALATNTMTSSNITFSLNLRMIIQNYPSGFLGNNYQLVFQGQLESIYTNATVPLSIVVNVDFLNLLASLQTFVPVLGLVTADNSLTVGTTLCPANYYVTQMRVNRQVGTGYITAVGFQCGFGNLFYSPDKNAITYYSLNATGVGVSYRNNNSVFLMASPARCPVTGIALDYGASEAVPRNISIACPNTPYYNVSSPSSVNVYQCPGGYVATGINAFTNFDGSIIEGLGLFCSSNAFISQTVSSSLSLHGNLVQNANGGDWTLTIFSIPIVFSNMNLQIGDGYKDVFSSFSITLPNSSVQNVSSSNPPVFLNSWQSGAINVTFTINYGTLGFDPTKIAYPSPITFFGVSLGSIFGHLQFYNIPLNLVIDSSIPATRITTRQTTYTTQTLSTYTTSTTTSLVTSGTTAFSTSSTSSNLPTTSSLTLASSATTTSVIVPTSTLLSTSTTTFYSTSLSMSLTTSPVTSSWSSSSTTLYFSSQSSTMATSSSTTTGGAPAGSSVPLLYIALGIGGGVIILGSALVLIFTRRKYHHFRVNLSQSLRKRQNVNASTNALIPQNGNSFSVFMSVPVAPNSDPSSNIIMVPQGVIQMQPMGNVIVHRSGSNQSFSSIGRTQ